MLNYELELIKNEINNCKTIKDLSKKTNIPYDILELEILFKKHEYDSIFEEIDVSKFYEQVRETILNDKPISNISNVSIINIFEHDHEICTEITFHDQDGTYRFGQLMWNSYGPGTVYYSEYCEEAKKDLINDINNNLKKGIR